MVKWLPALLLVTMGQMLAHAGVPLAVKDLPQPVSRSISGYFPGAQILAAERDTDDGRTQFEVKIRYKDINLVVDVNPQGKILDVDMVK